MRTFTIHPTVASLIASVESFTVHGPGVLPALAETPPAGLDAENAALYQEIRRVVILIQANVERWRTQALLDGQASQQISAP